MKKNFKKQLITAAKKLAPNIDNEIILDDLPCKVRHRISSI
jgi:hypothetical protein